MWAAVGGFLALPLGVLLLQSRHGEMHRTTGSSQEHRQDKWLLTFVAGASARCIVHLSAMSYTNPTFLAVKTATSANHAAARKRALKMYRDYQRCVKLS